MRVGNNVLIAIVVLAGLILLSITGLLIAGRDVSQVMYLATSVLIPTFVVIATGKAQANQNAAIEQKVDVVHTLTNGNTSRLLGIIEAGGVDTTALREHLKSVGWVDPDEDADQPVTGRTARRAL